MGRTALTAPVETEDEGERDWRAHRSEQSERQCEDAESLLHGDYSDEPAWFSAALNDLVGPPIATQLWIIGARPSGGKTTFLLNWVDGLVRNDWPVLVAPMEVHHSVFRLQWAAWACDLPIAPLLRKQWRHYSLPTDARDRIRDHLQWQRKQKDFIHIIENERLSIRTLQEEIVAAQYLGYGRGPEVVLLDHLHRMNWGTGDATADMSEGMVALKQMAQRNQLRIVAAAQLSRPTKSVLEDYRPPPLSSIKQTGAAEQEADTVLMLHRTLRKGASKGDISMVENGQMEVADVAEDRTMSVRIAKCRLDGDVRDRTVHLYLNAGRLYDSAVDRDYASARATQARATPLPDTPAPREDDLWLTK